MPQVDDGARLAHLLLEVIDQTPHRLNQLAFALAKGLLLVLDIINLALVLLNKFLVPVHEDSEGTLLLLITIFVFTVDLRLLKAILDLFKLLAEAIEYVFDG